MQEYRQKKIITFDLDGTLTPSKSKMDREMGELLCRLLKTYQVAVISGGGFPQFQEQFLSVLAKETPHEVTRLFTNLLVLPTSGGQFYSWDETENTWKKEYAENLTEEEKKRISAAILTALDQVHFVQPEKLYGPQIEDRESQITFSALGQGAPVDEKKVYDPDKQKREPVRQALMRLIPEFEIRTNATTSVDITRKGVDKAYGMKKICEITGCSFEDILFIGDGLFEGGNDYPVKTLGIETVAVTGPDEVKEFLRKELL